MAECSISTFRIPTWTTPFVILLFATALIPGTSLLGHLCSVGVGYTCMLQYSKSPFGEIERWTDKQIM